MADRYPMPYKIKLRIRPWRRISLRSDDYASFRRPYYYPSKWVYEITDDAGNPVVSVELRRRTEDRRWRMLSMPSASHWPVLYASLASAKEAAEEWVWDYFYRGCFCLDVFDKDDHWARVPVPQKRHLPDSHTSRSLRSVPARPLPTFAPGGISDDKW